LRAIDADGDVAINMSINEYSGSMYITSSDAAKAVTSSVSIMPGEDVALQSLSNGGDTLVRIATTGSEGRITLRSTGSKGLSRVEIGEDGIYFFDETRSDTTMILHANGSISGKGKLSMGKEHGSLADWANVLGYANEAAGDSAVVSGGFDNSADGRASAVGGGSGNKALGIYSVIKGGTDNMANATASSVGGGVSDTASGYLSTVAGGGVNVASAEGSTVSGGIYNTATDNYATVGGGNSNSATGYSSTVPGGEGVAANGRFSLASGRRARAYHTGCFVWADSTNDNFTSSGPNQFLVRASGGVGINTDSPSVVLHIDGGNDVSVGSGGYIMAGETTGRNVTLDDNEIMARDNGGAGVLHINSGSGNVDICVGGGMVGVGTTSPSEKLTVSGNICYTGTIGACSDVRYKRDVGEIRSALETVMQLRGVTYNWKQDEYPDHEFDDQTHLGFIAQEVKELLPSLVMTDNSGYMSVDYSRLTPLLVEAMKDLKSENDELRSELNEIKALLKQPVDNQQ
jgi:hypothetical protein